MALEISSFSRTNYDKSRGGEISEEVEEFVEERKEAYYFKNRFPEMNITPSRREEYKEAIRKSKELAEDIELNDRILEHGSLEAFRKFEKEERVNTRNSNINRLVKSLENNPLFLMVLEHLLFNECHSIFDGTVDHSPQAITEALENELEEFGYDFINDTKPLELLLAWSKNNNLQWPLTKTHHEIFEKLCKLSGLEFMLLMNSPTTAGYSISDYRFLEYFEEILKFNEAGVELFNFTLAAIAGVGIIAKSFILLDAVDSTLDLKSSYDSNRRTNASAMITLSEKYFSSNYSTIIEKYNNNPMNRKEELRNRLIFYTVTNTPLYESDYYLWLSMKLFDGETLKAIMDEVYFSLGGEVFNEVVEYILETDFFNGGSLDAPIQWIIELAISNGDALENYNPLWRAEEPLTIFGVKLTNLCDSGY